MPTYTDNTALVIRYQQGDSTAGEQLLAANSGLVYRIAWKFAPGGGSLDVEDLVQEGRLGLLRADQSFDPSRGFQFST
jgi:RNA polymerase sigma factor (sigma-70 family)